MERNLATVLFVDLVGSTALVTGTDPEIARRRVQQYFDKVSHCVTTHGGIVEKFAGDAVMAAFGIPQAHEDDPERAVRLGRAAWQSAPSVSSADAYSWALYRARQIAAASRLSAEAMRLGSRDPEFLYHAGMIARASGDEPRAARLLGRLLHQSPHFSALDAPRAREALRDVG